MAQLDIAEKRLPQDGRITLRVGGKPVDVRVSTLPTGHDQLGKCTRDETDDKRPDDSHGSFLRIAMTVIGRRVRTPLHSPYRVRKPRRHEAFPRLVPRPARATSAQRVSAARGYGS